MLLSRRYHSLVTAFLFVAPPGVVFAGQAHERNRTWNNDFRSLVGSSSLAVAACSSSKACWPVILWDWRLASLLCSVASRSWHHLYYAEGLANKAIFISPAGSAILILQWTKAQNITRATRWRGMLHWNLPVHLPAANRVLVQMSTVAQLCPFGSAGLVL